MRPISVLMSPISKDYAISNTSSVSFQEKRKVPCVQPEHLVREGVPLGTLGNSLIASEIERYLQVHTSIVD